MKKKKTLKILLPVIVVLLAVAVFFGIKFKSVLSLVFNWDNAVSFVNSQRYNREELENKMKDNQEKMEQIAKENPHINIRGDLTPEEAKALAEGKITKEDAAAIVKGDITLEEIIASGSEELDGKTDSGKETTDPSENDPANKPDSGKETSKPPEEKEPSDKKPEKEPEKPSDKTEDKTEDKPNTTTEQDSDKENVPEPVKDRPSEIIAELYVVQADFISRIEAIGDKAYADYEAIRYKREQIPAIVNSYSGEVSALEKECDNKVKDLLTELETELKKVEGDLSVINEIRTFYYKEKSLKKSYYLNRLNDEDYK